MRLNCLLLLTARVTLNMTTAYRAAPTFQGNYSFGEDFNWQETLISSVALPVTDRGSCLKRELGRILRSLAFGAMPWKLRRKALGVN